MRKCTENVSLHVACKYDFTQHNALQDRLQEALVAGIMYRSREGQFSTQLSFLNLQSTSLFVNLNFVCPLCIIAVHCLSPHCHCAEVNFKFPPLRKLGKSPSVICTIIIFPWCFSLPGQYRIIDINITYHFCQLNWSRRVGISHKTVGWTPSFHQIFLSILWSFLLMLLICFKMNSPSVNLKKK